MRIGIFGGTFDPVHFGHLRPAVELAERYDLNTLYLMPNHIPVHRGPTHADTAQRIKMLELAIEGAPHLAIDTREALRKTASYTLHSVEEVRAENPQATVLFFMGLDAFAEFDTWHDWQGILALANLVVVNRPGATHSEFSKNLVQKQQDAKGQKIVNGSTGVIQQCDVTQLEISATDVRRRINEDLSVRFLLPEQVSEYIVHQRLYRISK
ncbi:MAG: nicotinate-nucleotide adenylyltransferase [Granulosicoccus sp.]